MKQVINVRLYAMLIILLMQMFTVAGQMAPLAGSTPSDNRIFKNYVTLEERKAAAEGFWAEYQAKVLKNSAQVPVQAVSADAIVAAMPMAMPGVDQQPHYFGPFPNYANSPVPESAAVVEIIGEGIGAAATATVVGGVITGVTVTDGGSGYTIPPTVVFTGGSGSGATATATVSGSVTGLSITNSGSGYTSPSVAVSGDGTGAAASATGAVDAISLSAQGAGYTSPSVAITGDGTGASAVAKGPVDAVMLTAPGTGYVSPSVAILGDGTGAIASAILAPTSVASVNLGISGSGYTSPSVAVSGDGTGAAASATGAVDAISLSAQGAGYTSPVVTLTGGDGTGAEASVTGKLDAIVVSNPGSGYTSPVVALSGGGGAGADAIAAVDETGAITGITIVNGGAGYTSAPDVSIFDASGTGTGAIAVATLSADTIVLNNPGAGYSSAPSVVITDSAGTGTGAAATATLLINNIALINGGDGYTSVPLVSITDSAGTGTGAAATALLAPSSITGIALKNGGIGYTQAPSISIMDPAGTGASASATIAVDNVMITNGGSGYSSAPSVVITDSAGTGTGAAARATLLINSLAIVNSGAGYTALPSVLITDTNGTGSGALAVAEVTADSVANITLTNGGSGYFIGGIRKFIDSLPGLGEAGANNLGQYIPVAVPDTTTYPGADYYEIALVQYRQQMHSDLPPTLLRGYVQLETPDNFGISKHIALNHTDGTPVLKADGTQAIAVDEPHYLGPIIVSKRDIPVRIKFNNLLPKGEGGNLFLPVDKTVMGAGMGPLQSVHHVMVTSMGMGYTSAPTVTITGGGGTGAAAEAMIMDGMVHHIMVTSKGKNYTSAPSVTISGGGGTGAAAEAMIMMEEYTENRATIHLHGGYVPWISDGTPHQWITPAGEDTQYPKGVSVQYVPDMWFVNGNVIPNTTGQVTPPAAGASNNPGDGSMTFYYNNQQSARLQFYHDHSYGITRLNVYAGEAAGYLITDDVEKDLIEGTNLTGVNPTGAKLLPDLGIPLVIQDKTFVDAQKISFQDPTWSWGSMPGMAVTGDLWMPHVYMPNQNPYDISGMNAFGRWHYGPWFWPPTTNIKQGPVENPYYDPVNAPWEPPMIPGVPNNSMAMEAFMDTPVVNGVAYPYMEVEPRAYRFRILNAANDRFFNLQIYEADPDVITGDGRTSTEVRMVPAASNPSYPEGWPADGREGGVPDPSMRGPSFIQIGTEGGFLPKPVKLETLPIDWNMDQTNFDMGVVNQGTLIVGPAERADVIVDFSKYAGKTLILYNDAPAPFPALDPRYDYYTGHPDLTEVGGMPPTEAGYGPNTRTVMQIRVKGTAAENGTTVDRITLLNGGMGYSSPEVTITGGEGSGASATAVGEVDRISLSSPGTGYTSAAVSITGGGGIGAAAVAKVEQGMVTSITLTNKGSGYTSAPSVKITGNGNGAAARATLSVTGISLTSGGTGFMSAPAVVITDPVGTGAGAIAAARIVNNAAEYDMAALESVFARTQDKHGVFEVSQDEVIIPQSEYNTAYNKSFALDPYVRIDEMAKTFQTVSGSTATIPFEKKAIQDEQGEAFETDYGRMSGLLGLEIRDAQNRQKLLLYAFPSPPVDLLKNTISGSQIGSLEDGTQIWKITHNGVDTHTIHFHLFNVQLINRVAWDNALRLPDPNELGWKETVRVNPLQDTIVALRPIAPTQPFDIPNSERLIDVTMPEGAELNGGPNGWQDVNGNPVSVKNHKVNYGWEYMEHCHILGHEEMDMMHAMSLAVAPNTPSGLAADTSVSPVMLTWTDNSKSETGFIIERALDENFTSGLAQFAAGQDVTAFSDNSAVQGTTYYYRVYATNVVGDTTVYMAPAVGFPTKTMNSGFTNTVAATIPVTITAPANLQGSIVSNPLRIRLIWTDASDNEVRFVVWRSENGGPFSQIGTVARSASQRGSTGGTVTYTNSNIQAAPLVAGNTYRYYVTAVDAAGFSSASNQVDMVFAAPNAPANLNGAAVRINMVQDRVTLTWTDNSNNEAGFIIQRSTSPNFANRNTYNVGANVATFSQSVIRTSDYYYRVRAANAVGDSAWSNAVFVATP